MDVGEKEEADEEGVDKEVEEDDDEEEEALISLPLVEETTGLTSLPVVTLAAWE